MESPAAGEVKDDQDLAAIEPDVLTDDELEAAVESEGEAEAVNGRGSAPPPSSNPTPHPEVPQRSGGREGAHQGRSGWLGPSFEAR